MRTFSFIAGLVCILSALLDAFQTVILPRRATGRFRLTRLFYVFTWTPWSAIASRIKHPRKRETALSFYGPLSLVFLIVAWAAALVVGFSLMYFGLGSHFTDSLGVTAGFRTDLYVSGTTLFTLGLGDVVPRNPWTRELIILESGMGLGFVAVVIGYFPVLYGAFSRRERSAFPCWMLAPDRRLLRSSCCAATHLKVATQRSRCCWRSGSAGPPS